MSALRNLGEGVEVLLALTLNTLTFNITLTKESLISWYRWLARQGAMHAIQTYCHVPMTKHSVVRSCLESVSCLHVSLEIPACSPLFSVHMSMSSFCQMLAVAGLCRSLAYYP